MVFYLATCAAAQELWPGLLRRLAKLVIAGLPHVSHSDALRDTSHDPSVSKRRRISGGVLGACAERSASHHISMGTVAEMEGVASRASCTRYHESAVTPHLAAAWAKAGSMYVCGLSMDCKRLGNPAEELCCYFMVDAATSEATWLPFQVSPGAPGSLQAALLISTSSDQPCSTSTVNP